MRAIVKGLFVWLLASLPVGMGLGALVSAYMPADAVVSRSTAAVNGVGAGAELALLGAIVAAVTTHVSRGALQRVGGSEFVTGAVIAYGLIIIGLLVLLMVHPLV